ncbi:MAG: mechanosensitive ion channel [Muribaculaceae bacterium]|nr:mechanosensitive ion channel [Muribaculaceae bacterium]
MILLKVIPTHTVASWLLNTIDGMLNHLGLSHYEHLEDIIYIVIISLLSVLIGILLKKLILFITRKAVSVKQSGIAYDLHTHEVFTKCSHIIPPLVFLALIPFAFESGSTQLHWIMRIVGVYILITFAMGINAVISFMFDRFNAKDNRKNLPLKGVRNVAIGIVWIVIVILAVCILLDKSPATLLAGLGAFAAALMLIFKDSILGFVAGIQMSDNDMIHVGDWIIVPGTPANGIVQDVSLSTVKIQNWDFTTVMVPPYTLVSTSFQNYKSMYDLNVRRIMNSFIVDILSIKTIDDAFISDICTKYPVMTDFVTKLRNQGTLVQSDPGLKPENGTLETNLGLFRAYVGIYLCSHPKISQDQRIMVRLLQGSDMGIPLQIWCFTALTNWDEYEGIQSEIMEHIAAAANDFGGLRIYSANHIGINSPENGDVKTELNNTAQTSSVQ